jgi:hypothetical protein
MAIVEERVSVVERCANELRDQIEGMNGKLTAILVSIATAAVLLAINLVVGGFAK